MKDRFVMILTLLTGMDVQMNVNKQIKIMIVYGNLMVHPIVIWIVGDIKKLMTFQKLKDFAMILTLSKGMDVLIAKYNLDLFVLIQIIINTGQTLALLGHLIVQNVGMEKQIQKTIRYVTIRVLQQEQLALVQTNVHIQFQIILIDVEI